MEEGEFCNDCLDGTFGRRIYMSSKMEVQIGWFLGTGNDSKLHGYGKLGEKEGLFENGKLT